MGKSICLFPESIGQRKCIAVYGEAGNSYKGRGRCCNHMKVEDFEELMLEGANVS